MRIERLALIFTFLLLVEGTSAYGQSQAQTTMETKSVQAPGITTTETTVQNKGSTVKVDSTTTTESAAPIRTSPPPEATGRTLEQSIHRSVEVSTAQITPQQIRADHGLARRLAKSR